MAVNDKKEWHNKVPRAISMLLHLKNYMLECGDNSEQLCNDVFGLGKFVVADNIDRLIEDYNITKTQLASKTQQYEMYYDGYMEWRNLGFDYDPSEYSEERQAELKALAERWSREAEEKSNGND